MRQHLVTLKVKLESVAHFRGCLIIYGVYGGHAGFELFCKGGLRQQSTCSEILHSQESHLCGKGKGVVPAWFPEGHRSRQLQKFYGRKRNCFGLAIVPGWRALRYATRARKLKKENMKNLWEIRLNAACNEHGMDYHTFMTSLTQADIGLNRKVLTDLAIYEPRTFQSLVQFAKQRQLEVGLESITIDSPHGLFHRGLPNKS